MARKHYARDYRLIDSVDERGHIRTDTEYIGAYYRYTGGYEAAQAARKRLWVSALGAGFCFLLALLPRSTASLTMYVTLPFLFAALPLGLLLAALYRLRQLGQRLDRRAADIVNDHLPARCLALFLLPLLALAGEGIALLRGAAFLPGDALFLAGALGCAGCGLVCFKARRALEAVKEDGVPTK